jgi:hypothetical protein
MKNDVYWDVTPCVTAVKTSNLTHLQMKNGVSWDVTPGVTAVKTSNPTHLQMKNGVFWDVTPGVTAVKTSNPTHLQMKNDVSWDVKPCVTAVKTSNPIHLQMTRFFFIFPPRFALPYYPSSVCPLSAHNLDRMIRKIKRLLLKRNDISSPVNIHSMEFLDWMCISGKNEFHTVTFLCV